MKLTKKREEQLLQLINDISEDMNMSRWSKSDYSDAVKYLQHENQKDINRFNSYHSKVVLAITKLI